MNFMFWNFNSQKAKKSPQSGPRSPQAVLADAARSFGIDVLALAECKTPDVLLLDALKAVDPLYNQADIPHRRIKLFVRFPESLLRPYGGNDRLAICRYEDHDKDILISIAHFHDIRNYPHENDRFHLALDSVDALLRAEDQAEHKRTILFGDLNFHPYEVGLLSPRSFGAMITRQLALRHSQPEEGREIPTRFYNPMWSMWGREHTPGTYYLANNLVTNHYWYCPDGILVRPALCEGAIFKDDEVQILRRITRTDGSRLELAEFAEKHWHIRYSDHLPIIFRLNLP